MKQLHVWQDPGSRIWLVTLDTLDDQGCAIQTETLHQCQSQTEARAKGLRESLARSLPAQYDFPANQLKP